MTCSLLLLAKEFQFIYPSVALCKNLYGDHGVRLSAHSGLKSQRRQHEFHLCQATVEFHLLDAFKGGLVREMVHS